MGKRAAFVWNGGASPLMGKTYARGDELPAELVDGLRNKNALLSVGKIKVVMVEGVTAPSTSTEKTVKKSTSKKKTTSVPKVENKAEKDEEPVEDEDTAPEEE